MLVAFAEEQKRKVERVPLLSEMCDIIYKTQYLRMGDAITNGSFQFAGELQRKMFSDIAVGSLEAHNAEVKLPEHTEAVCCEFIFAAFNDILPSENTEAVFGVEPPVDIDEKDTVANIVDDCLGLLTFRAWKMLLRRPEGRHIILDVAGVSEADEKSYSIIRETLQQWVLADALQQNFMRCVEKLEVSAQPAHYALSAKEKQKVLATKHKWQLFR